MSTSVSQERHACRTYPQIQLAGRPQPDSGMSISRSHVREQRSQEYLLKGSRWKREQPCLSPILGSCGHHPGHTDLHVCPLPATSHRGAGSSAVESNGNVWSPVYCGQCSTIWVQSCNLSKLLSPFIIDGVVAWVYR